jgi:hypothetical protein
MVCAVLLPALMRAALLSTGHAPSNASLSTSRTSGRAPACLVEEASVPHILNDIVSADDLATMHATYMEVCAEMNVQANDAVMREVIARLIVQLHRRGVDDALICLAAARRQLV